MLPFKTVVRMLALLVVVCAADAAAQSQRPLGAEPGERPLTVSASTFGGYDTDITTTGAASQAGVPAAASYGGVALTTSYSSGTSSGVSLYTIGSTEYRYYRADQAIKAPLASGGAGIGAGLGRRMTVNASVDVGYFPQFQFSILPPTTTMPVDAPPPTLDYGISNTDVVSYQGTAAANYSLSRRSSLGFSYSRSHFKYVGDDYKLSSYGIGARYSYSLTRYASLQLGYSEQSGRYVIDDIVGPGPTSLVGPSSNVRYRNIDAGINYSRPLSLSRRTTFGFSTGSTAVDDGRQTYYSLSGNAHLNHRLSRRWNLGAAYSRGMSLVGGFREPLFADSASVSIDGAFGDRVHVGASSGYSNGKFGLEAERRNYKSIQSSARIEVPLVRRRLSLFGSYFHYRSEFEESVVLPTGFPPHLDRHGVRGGLTLRVY